MNKTGEYSFYIDSYLTDFQGKATLPFLANLLLQVATKHAEERGFGYNYVRSMGRAWVLSRLVMEFERYPAIDERIVVSTWITGVNRMFTERHFAFCNSEGEAIGYAKSVWASINVQTRRPENVLDMYGLVDFVTQKYNPIENIHKMPPLKDAEQAGKFTVRYSDIDINNHLNSVKYIEHFVDMFNIEQFNDCEIGRIEVHFAAEATFGQRIFLFKKQETPAVFLLEMRDDEKLISAARVQWKPKNIKSNN